MPPKRERIDKLLVERGLAGSRERARRLIMSGEVWAAGQRVDKPGALLPADTAVEVRGSDIPFVSRGGMKLDAALTHWNIDVRDRVAVDIGASTGGFTIGKSTAGRSSNSTAVGSTSRKEMNETSITAMLGGCDNRSRVKSRMLARSKSVTRWSWRKATSRSTNGSAGISNRRMVSARATNTGCEVRPW